jgi:hypothetical protein
MLKASAFSSPKSARANSSRRKALLVTADQTKEELQMTIRIMSASFDRGDLDAAALRGLLGTTGQALKRQATDPGPTYVEGTELPKMLAVAAPAAERQATK